MKKFFVIILICILLLSTLTGCKNDKESILNNVENIESIEKYNTDDIVALSEIWMRAKQISPFWDENRIKEWDKLYEEALNKLMALKKLESSQYETYEVFEEFVSFLDDGHVNVIPSEKQSYSIGFLPYFFTYSDGKYYIEYKIENSDIPLGSEILEINGEPVASYISKQINKISVKTKGAYEYSAIKRVRMGELNSTVKLSYIDSITDKIETIELSFDIEYNDANNHNLEGLKANYTYVQPLYSSSNYTVRDSYDAAYLNINSFMSEDMIVEFYDNVLPIIKKFNLLVIDVRNNGGGNALNGYKILELLTGVKAEFGKSYSQYNNVYDIALASGIKYYKVQNIQDTVGIKMLNNLNIVSTSTLNNHIEGELPSLLNLNMENHEIFKGKIGILTSYKSGSATDDFAMFAKQIDQCKVYGTNTKGATGLIAVFELKNKMTFSLSSLDSRTNKGEKIQNVGIQPDFYVELDMNKLIKGKRDSQIEYALNHMRNKLERPKY